MSDIIGKILGVILAFILCILAPLTIIAMSDDMADRRAIYAEMTNFVDQVIDTGVISKEVMTDFIYGVSSHGPICEVKIKRQMRVVNPGPGGKVVTSYVPYDLFVEAVPIELNKGDLIEVAVEAVEYRGAQQVARLTLGAALQPIKYTVVGRIR